MSNAPFEAPCCRMSARSYCIQFFKYRNYVRHSSMRMRHVPCLETTGCPNNNGAHSGAKVKMYVYNTDTP